MNAVLYLPRIQGGRGLRSTEQTYKEVKIKACAKLFSNHDKRIKLVKLFHKNNYETSSYSIFKDATKFATEMGLKFELNEEGFSIHFPNATELVNEEDGINVLKSRLVRVRNTNYLNQIINSNWQGVMYKIRMNDENLVPGYFDWLAEWKLCQTSDISEFFSLFYQTLSTKCYQKTRSNEIIIDTTCRLCHKGEESIRHLISNCGTVATKLYKTRHDNAFKNFVFPLLSKFNLINQTLPWFTQNNVDPVYENSSTVFLWDIPEYSERDDENNEFRPLRPDAKLIMKGDKMIFVIEMIVPWITNRREKIRT